MNYQELCAFPVLYRAYLEARKGKRGKYATAQYEANVLEYTERLSRALSEKRYVPSGFDVFRVHEPKPRLVQAPAFVDKVVQHAIMDNYLYDELTKSFIYDNYASQKGKGVHFGLDRLKGFFSDYYRKNDTTDGWVLKCDVKSFFASINHGILKQKLIQKVSDRDILNLLFAYIDSTEGLPLGYQTSQIFALLYLDDFDHYVKEALGIKYYGRYMDDFYLIHRDKNELRRCLDNIQTFMRGLKLELNNKTHIFPLRNGIDFLGYHTYLTDSGKVVRKLRRTSIKRMNAKLKRWGKAYPKGEVTEQKILECWRAWDNHASHGNTYTVRQRVRLRVVEILGKPIPPTKNEKKHKHF